MQRGIQQTQAERPASTAGRHLPPARRVEEGEGAEAAGVPHRHAVLEHRLGGARVEARAAKYSAKGQVQTRETELLSCTYQYISHQLVGAGLEAGSAKHSAGGHIQQASRAEFHTVAL